jgi:multidrug efflux system outer membrane protein
MQALRSARSIRNVEARLIASALAMVILAGCADGPKYKRPPIVAPEETRGQIGPAEAASLADLPWWQVFQDPVLQQLVTDAIRDSFDFRTAILRVERCVHTCTRRASTTSTECCPS